MDKNGHIKKERLSTATKKKLFLEALKSSLGIITTAMRVAGIESRTTIANWRKSDAKFDAQMCECEATCGDFVETQLLKKIKGGDTTAIIFYCKTKLKERGFTERAEVTGKDGKDLVPARILTKEEAAKYLKELEDEC